MLPLQARVDLGVMAMKGYSAFPKAQALLETHHHMGGGGDLTLLQRCSWCILQPQPTELLGQVYCLISEVP